MFPFFKKIHNNVASTVAIILEKITPMNDFLHPIEVYEVQLLLNH